MIQQYRVSLNCSLLDNAVPTNLLDSGQGSSQNNNLQSRTTTSGTSYANVLKPAASNSSLEELIARKRDKF